jgi:hypothetical protein
MRKRGKRFRNAKKEHAEIVRKHQELIGTIRKEIESGPFFSK